MKNFDILYITMKLNRMRPTGIYTHKIPGNMNQWMRVC